MNLIHKKTALVMAMIICAATGARADMAAGDYTLSFGTNVLLWDFSGSYTDYLADLPLEYTISIDPSGKLTGSGSAIISDDTGDVNFAASLKGTVRSAGNVVRINVNIKFAGQAQIEDRDVHLSVSATESLELDPVNLQLIGTARGKATVSVPGLGSHSAPMPPTDVQVSLPPNMTGTWGLTLSVSTNQNKYGGTALATLSSGRAFPLLITGTYAAKTDSSRLTLKGADLNRAINIALSASVTNAQITPLKFKAKALGQTLRVP